MKRLVGPALALTAGILWAFCHGRQGLVLAPWLVLAPLVLLLGTRRPVALAFLHGLAFWAVSIWWIAPTLEIYGGLPAPLAWALLLVLAGYLALYHALFAWLGAPIWRRGGAWALAGLPALWVSLEWVRGQLLTGFPWNLAAYSAVEVPGALPLTAWIGSWGLSALVVTVNVGFALAWRRRRWSTALAPVLAALTLLAAAARWAVPASAVTDREIGLPVRIVQPNIPNLTTYDEQRVLANYQRLLELSVPACERGSLVIWPESAVWPFNWQTSPMLQRDLGRFAAAGCSVLFNTATTLDGRDYNSLLLVGPGDARARYDKRHLVPYGEYVPLGELFPFIGTVARAAGSFTAADEIRLVRWRGERLGGAICFEIVFPGEVAQTVRAGATALVTVTNDAWYGDTAAPWQHFRAARFRAAETGRPVLRAAVTGISGWIEPDGSVKSRLGVDAQGVLAGRLAGRTDLTLFVRAPWLVPMLAGVLAAFAILICWRGRNR